MTDREPGQQPASVQRSAGQQDAGQQPGGPRASEHHMARDHAAGHLPGLNTDAHSQFNEGIPGSTGYLAPELAFASQLAVEAGETLLRHFVRGIEVQMKGFADPVTAADKASEALIRQAILLSYPEDGVEGEEDAPRAGSSGRTWLVDPLDGTANYAAGHPLFAVVLALIEDSNRDHALLNITYDPIRRELFHAVQGGGAYLNGRLLQASACADLSRALVHLHFSSQREVWELSLELAHRVTERSPHARNIGSTALAQAYVAAGRLDAHAKVLSGAYDVIGGNLLIEEAGGLVTDLAGQPWRAGGTLLAAAPGVHPLLVDRIRGLPI